MKKEIYIIFDKTDTNFPMVNLLEAELIKMGVAPILQPKSEYEVENVKHELLGTTKEDSFAIFIGKINEALYEKINWKYEKIGMKYGWNVNQAMLYVDNNKLSENELSELTKLSTKYVDEGSTINKFKSGLKNISKKLDGLPTGVKLAGAIGGTALFGIPATLAAGTAFIINGQINKSKVFENQQKYLVKIFCVNGLTEFVGEL
jgi:hypothetical protein